MKAIALNLVAWHRDNGDGSNSVSLYNSREDIEKELNDLALDFSLEDIQGADDPYTTGTLMLCTMHLLLDEDTGEVMLSKKFVTSSD